MLPRVVPENPSPYDQTGKPPIRYTGDWATRALGTVPQLPYTSPAVVSSNWEPKNTIENICWVLFVAVFKLCCAIAFTCLGIFHWATNLNDQIKYNYATAAQLTMTGLASTFVAGLAVVAFFPDKRGRLTKRMMVIFSIPALYLLLGTISGISQIIGQIAANKQPVDGFYVAEVILTSFLLGLNAVILYPASEACIPPERQRNVAIRAISLSANTVVGAITLIYFCFAIYGVHDAFANQAYYSASRIHLSTMALPTTSVLILVSLGAYSAVGRGIRSHIIPYIVVGIVALTMFLGYTSMFTLMLNNEMSHDWHDNAYVALFALNCLSIAGLTVTVSLSIVFAYY